MPLLVSSVVVPGADTPLFYLVSSSSTPSINLLGSGGPATLTGSGPIGQYYFFQGRLTVLDPAGTTYTYRPVIDAVSVSADCSTYGSLGFVQGSSTDKCALYDSFHIQSDTENSQLGAKLVFNFAGGFYVCGSSHDVWYKVNREDGPSECSLLDLYTVPVV
ncbi:hypothetical protein BYT27DRAFT_7225108 [Phlegmacium glaucopus]|nr:hypothetical protein BYT27DRAFT_7225108 [Phlegmacium glaucopus]